MTPQEFRRRAMMNFGASGDKWDGFEFGCFPNDYFTRYSDNYNKVAITPWVTFVTGHSLTFATGFRLKQQSNLRQMCFPFQNEDGTREGFNSMTTPTRTLGTVAPFTKVRMPFDFDNIANAYIKDETTGEYLWRGSDYVE